MHPAPLRRRSRAISRPARLQYSSLDEASSFTSRFRCRPLSNPGHETVNEANVSVGLSTIPHLANSPVGYFRRQPAAARIQNRNSDVVAGTVVDDHLPLPGFAELLPDVARGDVRPAARREADENVDGLRRIVGRFLRVDRLDTQGV